MLLFLSLIFSFDTCDLMSYDFTHMTSIPYLTHVTLDFTFSHDSYLPLTHAQLPCIVVQLLLTHAQLPLIVAQSSLTQCTVLTHAYPYQKSL